ncbi:MAG: phosphatase PAP2 family protein, partial [Bacteroidota bacterium]
MLETVLQFDQLLFEIINQQLHYPFLDTILPYWREKTTWIPLYLLILGWAFWQYQWRAALLIIVMLCATVGVADTVSSKIIKKQVERPRPCNNVHLKSDVLLLVDCGSGYSFTSSHATNHFSVAVFLILLWGRRLRWLKFVALFWASVIAFAQV